MQGSSARLASPPLLAAGLALGKADPGFLLKRPMMLILLLLWNGLI
jgi:hypothetical protein